MLRKKLLSSLPLEYNYEKSKWYKNISDDIFLNTRRLIIISVIVASFFPLTFLSIDLLSDETAYILNYTIPLAALYIILASSIFLRSSRIMVPVILSISFAGFFLAAYLPQSRQVSLFIMIAFVPFAFQIAGLVRGAIWSLLFSTSVAFTHILSLYNIIPKWNIVFSEFHLLMIFLAVLITFILLFSGSLQNEKHLWWLIRHLVFDPSSGLPNKEAMINSFPSDKGFVLAIVRIQNFGELSSIFGYEIAEKIHLFVADTLKKIAQRDGYKCFKLLGHEFGILINEDSKILKGREISDFLNVLWHELRSIKLFERDQEFCPIYRIGAAHISSDNTGDALSRADIALNMADKLKHNVYIYNEDADDRVLIRQTSSLYSVLLDNIKNNNLKTVFQPIVDTLTGEVSWYEALLRIQKKDGTYESIFKYLQVARNTGLYNQISRFVLNSAHQAIVETGYDVSINITHGDIIHPGFMEEVISVCEDLKGRKGSLIIEIVECEELIEIDLCRNFMRTVQDMGCRIAVDDFGSGYSNFTTLLNLSIDIVKIDGMLIQSVRKDVHALSMIESISDFCHKSGKAIVAEYIENDFAHNIAIENRIHFCQGYYFGEPGSLQIINEPDDIDFTK
jgi:EAL domain-containing protein (putative c-di-GMP-specific phosphodiesterase class I)/GGDEF domain-containing protein